MQICLLRNITELAEVVTKAAFYFKHVFQTVLNNSTRNILEDYPNCGIRNNDTFNFNTLDGYNSPLWGNESTADWSVECLWDCAWKDNPYVGRTYQYNDTSRGYLTQVNITLSMPKVPVDLHCLTGCTDVNPPTLLDIYRAEPTSNTAPFSVATSSNTVSTLGRATDWTMGHLFPRPISTWR